MDKYFADAGVLLQAGRPDKILAEMGRLRKWVVKHQDEALSAGAQSRLLETAQLYFKFATAGTDPGSQILDEVHLLLDDLLKIPEGKLVSGKSKRSVLKWLESLRSAGSHAKGLCDANVVQCLLLTVDDDMATLMNEKTSDTFDVQISDRTLLGQIKETFEQGCEVLVSYDTVSGSVMSMN